jgi:hypothetical protein
MSLFSQTQRAFAATESTLAQIQGMARGGKNILFDGVAYVGVFGAAQVTDELSVGGGYKRRTELTVTITRDQFDSEPKPKKHNLTRTDMSPPITYTVNAINTHDAHHYEFVCEKVGA